LSQLSLVAVDAARRNAGLAEVDRSRRHLREGVSLGTALGATATSVRYARRLVKAGATATNPIDFPDSIDGAPAAHVALDLGLGGPSLTFVDGRASGVSALAYAARQIAWGRVERMYVVVGDHYDEMFGDALVDDPEFGVPNQRVCSAECVVALVLEAEGLRTLKNPIELVGFLPRQGDSRSGAEEWAEPCGWLLGSNGAVSPVAPRSESDGILMRDPSGSLELAASWLGTAGCRPNLLGTTAHWVLPPVAARVRCGSRSLPHLGFVGSGGT
jgi:hypothetical protein